MPQFGQTRVCARSLYVWRPDGASCVHNPLKKFSARSLTWAAGGGAAAVCDRDRFCLAYLA